MMTAISTLRPRRRPRIFASSQAAAAPAGVEVPVATASLLYFATRIEQQLAKLGPGRSHLIALRRRIRAELQLHEGLLLTIANSGFGPLRSTRSVEHGISRDPRLAAMFGGAGPSR